MANDELRNLMNAIMRAEKQYGDNHQYRHVFAALREARYAASKLSSNANYESPGTRSAREAAGEAHVPAPEDSRNPTVPESATTGDGPSGDPSGSS